MSAAHAASRVARLRSAARAVRLDARHALRLLRRSPGFAAALLLMLGLGIGAGGALLTLAAAGLSHPTPLESPAGLELPVQHTGARSATPEPPSDPSPPLFWGGRPQSGSAARLTVAQIQAEDLRSLLRTLLGGALLALAIACSSVAMLLFSRAVKRRPEVVMRAVLGASPGRLLRQLLVEAALLTALGTVLGVALGACALALLRWSWPAGLAGWALAFPPAWVVALSLGLSVSTALAFSLAPVLAARGPALHPRIAGGGRATAGPREGELRRRLAILAVASSLTLLGAAGILLRSFGGAAADRAPGYDPRDTLVLRLEAPARLAADAPRRADYFEAVLQRVRAVPGVKAESIASEGAWLGLGTQDRVHALTGIPTRPGILLPARYHSVSPGYFRALGIPLVQGREFTPEDRAGAPGVAVVSETFANRFFPRMPPVGRVVQLGGMSLSGPWYRVVGVVADVRPPGLGSASEPAPSIYLSTLQVPPSGAGLAVRAAGDPLRIRAGVERAVRGPAGGPASTGAVSLEEYLARHRAPLAWLGRVFAGLAAFAALLAAFGLYGVISELVTQRRREIGIRMALGARPARVTGSILAQSLRLTARGVLLGAAGTLCLGRLLQYLFFGVDLLDPVLHAALAALLGGVALSASYLPARRAARLDPAVALRGE